MGDDLNLLWCGCLLAGLFFLSENSGTGVVFSGQGLLSFYTPLLYLVVGSIIGIILGLISDTIIGLMIGYLFQVVTTTKHIDIMMYNKILSKLHFMQPNAEMQACTST